MQTCAEKYPMEASAKQYARAPQSIFVWKE